MFNIYIYQNNLTTNFIKSTKLVTKLSVKTSSVLFENLPKVLLNFSDCNFCAIELQIINIFIRTKIQRLFFCLFYFQDTSIGTVQKFNQ